MEDIDFVVTVLVVLFVIGRLFNRRGSRFASISPSKNPTKNPTGGKKVKRKASISPAHVSSASGSDKRQSSEKNNREASSLSKPKRGNANQKKLVSRHRTVGHATKTPARLQISSSSKGGSR